jgi:hypothetical protein
VQLGQQVDEQACGALGSWHGLSSEQTLRRSDRPQIGVEGDVATISHERFEVPKRMGLTRPAPTVENLVIDGLESRGNARVDEGLAKLVGLLRFSPLGHQVEGTVERGKTCRHGAQTTGV